jgi:hypothetical protein
MDLEIKRPMKSFKQKLQSNWGYLTIGLIAILGAIFLFYDMQWGPWVYSDSVAYIVSARNFAAGEGLGMPGPDGHFMSLTLHPPFYSLVLSFFIKFGIHAYTAIKWINIAAFAGSIIILGAGIITLTGSNWAGASTAILFLISPVLIANFDGAMTEPLYIFFSLCGLFLIFLFFKKQSLWLWIFAAIISGLAMLTRFIGAANIAAGMLMLLLLSQSTFLQRIKTSALFGIIAGLPSLLWMAYTSSMNAQAGARSFIIRENLIQVLGLLKKSVMEVLVTWVPYQYQFLPGWRAKSLAVYVILLITITLGILALMKNRSREQEKDNPFGKILIGSWLFIVCYAIVLAGSFVFASVQPDINERMLSPLLAVLFIVIPGTLFYAIQCRQLPRQTIIVPLLLVTITVSAYWPATQKILADRHEEGSGYTSRIWRDSPLMDAVRDLPADTVLISNQPAAVLLYLDRFPYDLSSVMNPISNPDLTTWGQEGSKLEQLMRDDHAALILFEPYFSDEITKMTGEGAADFIATFKQMLQPYQETFDGGIYYFTP